MNPRHLRRPLAALATTIACLAIMASPAAATPHDADITGGQITLVATPLTAVFDLAPATPTCPTSPPTLELDVTGTAASVTDLDVRDIYSVLTGGTTVLRVFTRMALGSTSGTLTGTSLTSLRVALVMTLYPAYDPTTCTPTGTPACTLAAVLDLGGTVTGTTVSDTFSLTGSFLGKFLTFPTCTAGPSWYVNAIPSLTAPLTGHLTS